mmetsp:Transcript_36017/g.90523  ORF Transcript_36017/g.90523 Transcript_36017/m.90523 type:complete len:340 (+) Transcript_36017:97-1116(+)
MAAAGGAVAAPPPEIHVTDVTGVESAVSAADLCRAAAEGGVTNQHIPRPYLEEDTGAEVNNKGSEDDGKLRCPRAYLEIDTEETTPAHRDERRISLDLTPLSCKSVKSTNSSAEYHKSDQTIIILDWDDTMCPSTTCMRDYGLHVYGDPPSGALAQALEEHAIECQLLLEQAAELADKVVIVTNAETGWVDLSCKAWLPRLRDCRAWPEVASARSTWEPQGVTSPAGWKARTFEDAIDKFYSRYPHQSWKNIISIGDAPHEREALSRVVRWAPTGSGKRCRSKSVKFVLRPSVQQLTREIQMLRESLKDICWHDDDLDLHFSAESLEDPHDAAVSSSAG